VLTNVFTH